MKQAVVLAIRGSQKYGDHEPEVIELVTEGTLEQTEKGWKLDYEESDLTGLAGVTTTFRVEPEQISLTRSGALRSQMVFRVGVSHDSLYQMELGTLMITVCATNLFFDITPDGGVVDLSYNIEIEKTEAGQIEYHLLIQPVD